MKNFKIYGSESTHLILSKKAQQFYSGTDPLTIREYDTENGCMYSYSIAGDPFTSLMSAEQLNRDLEQLADEFENC